MDLQDLTMMLPSRLDCPLSLKTPNMGNIGLGLPVVLWVPQGKIGLNAFILGPLGPIAGLADFTVLTAAPDFLEARDRAALGDVTAWTGRATVPKESTVVLNSVVLVVDSVTDGAPVLTLDDAGRVVHFRETGHDGQVYYLAPARPFRVTAPNDADASIDMALTVDRLGSFQLSDAVLQARYTTDEQPKDDRLQVETTSGAGFPYMRLSGRMALA